MKCIDHPNKDATVQCLGCSILGILAGIGVLNGARYRAKAEYAAIQSTLRSLMDGQDLYFSGITSLATFSKTSLTTFPKRASIFSFEIGRVSFLTASSISFIGTVSSPASSS